MKLVLVSRNHWECPWHVGVALKSPRNRWVIVSISNVSCHSNVIHWLNDRIIYFENVQGLHSHGTWKVIIEDDSSNLDAAVADQTIVLKLEVLALGLEIVEEVRGGPCSWSKPCKRAIYVVKDVSMGYLISDLDRDSSWIEMESREVSGTGSWISSGIEEAVRTWTNSWHVVRTVKVVEGDVFDCETFCTSTDNSLGLRLVSQVICIVWSTNDQGAAKVCIA